MSDPKAEWRDLPAGKELDYIVSVRLGFYDLEWSYFTNMWWGRKIPGEPQVVIPCWSERLEFAFTLFSTEIGLEWNLFSEDDEWITCELGHFAELAPSRHQMEQATEKTAALAIVRAWLKWQERTDHPAPELPKGTES